MRVNQLLPIYLQDVQQNRSRATYKAYRCHLGKFAVRFGETELNAIRPIELRQWLNDARLKSNGTEYAPDTVRAIIIAAEAFQGFAVANGELEKRITKLEKPQSRQRDRLPTSEEIAAIFNNAEEDFCLIYQALRRTGARPSELCGALIEQIEQSKTYRRIVIHNHKTARKTGKPKIIPVGEKLGQLLDQAIGDREVGPIFLRKSGKAWTSDSLGKTFRRIRDKAKLPAHLCVYLARHEVATKLCQKVGIAAARDALNHTNIKTTSRYVQRDEQKIIENQDLLE